ncbi:cupin-like domain-containing protein [Sphingomonas sp. DT-204]|uniref:cupin-like domain-containing protein n=1 Tax=Sphingomonas sp. DT-204 TaxID=3396166 RepID=UPI003F1AC2AB
MRIDPVSFSTFDDAWRGWIAENLALGTARDSLFRTLIDNGFHPEEARQELDAADRSPYLHAARLLAGRVAKRDWSLDVQLRTKRLRDAGPRGIDRRHRLGREAFLRDYYSANRPVVITGRIEDWPAMRWTPEDLAARFADRLVQVQTKRTGPLPYESEVRRHHEVMRFADFMRHVLDEGESNETYMTANNGSANMSVLPELWDDIVQIPEYLDSRDPANRGFFWIGPTGTITPTHHDLTNNFMAQILGRKRVHLVDGLDIARMYNRLHVYSEVDLETIDYARFPLMRDVEVLQYDLQPGELLFLPVGWWHQVRALDVSVTVTFTNFLFDNDFHSVYSTYREV